MTDSTADATTLDGTAMQTEQPTTIKINKKQISIKKLKTNLRNNNVNHSLNKIL
jgi:hypothetical protein